MKVFNDKGEFLTTQNGGIPGTWRTVATGSATVSFDTETVLATFTPASNQLFFPRVMLREPGNLSSDSFIVPSPTTSVPLDNEVCFAITRPATSTVYELRVRHKLKNSVGIEISGTFDFVLYQVVP